jgi:hypothetical protein
MQAFEGAVMSKSQHELIDTPEETQRRLRILLQGAFSGAPARSKTKQGHPQAEDEAKVEKVLQKVKQRKAPRTCSL